MAIKVGAKYIGGYPGGTGSEMNGELVASTEGLTFTWSGIQLLNSDKGEFTIPEHELVAVDFEAVDPVRALQPVMGNLRWSYGASSRILAIRCRRQETEFTALFECADLASRAFLEGWQSERQAAGLPRLPSIESLHPNPIETQQLVLLQDISAKLDRLIEALEKPS